MAVSDSIYTAPQSELLGSAEPDGHGSLERGIAGDYPFSVRAILRES